MTRLKSNHPIYAAAVSVLVACGTPASRPSDDPYAASTSPPPGPNTTQALTTAVFDALARRDHAAFAGLFLPEELALASCPNVVATVGKERFVAALARDRAVSEQVFATCAAEADWRAASDKSSPESSLHPTQKCSGLKTWSSVEPTAVIDGQGFSFRLNEHVEVGGRVYLVGGFTCGEGFPPTLGMPAP